FPEPSSTKEEDPFTGVFDDIQEEDEISENPASLITQEEYAALTDFSDENEDSGDDDTSDEIEWPEEDEIKAKAGNTFQAETAVDEDINAEPEDGSSGAEEMPVFEDTEEKEEPFTVPDHEEISLEENPFEDFSDANGDKGNLAEEVPSASDTAATLDPDFFDIDMNEETPEEAEEEAALEGWTGGFEANGNGAENDEAAPYEMEERVEEVNPFETPETSLSAEVFDDMEKEIRDELKGKKFTFTEPEQQSDFDSQEMPENKISDSLSAQNSAPSSRARAKGPYKIPTSLLEEYENDQYWIIDEQTKADSLKLKDTLNQFNIEAEIIGIKKGPVVTMFELAPAPGVKLSKIVTLQDNIALSLAASSVRIVAPIPGRAAVGIEVPNKHRSIVSFREMIEQDLPEYNKMAIPVILGKDILGKAQLLDLVKTPHLLIAGATGAGKSVCVNSMILSILYKRSPQQVKLILVDPKVVELKLYNDIPHLLTPVITEPKRALQSLQYCLCEMERRYALLDGMGVRDISSYNRRIEERNICTEKLPYIVVIIDEFADLMATTGKELESTIARLAAMSRAVGIHLVLATQRPSIDVITGLIKANIPTRIAFMVASKMDSRIIIDQVGAEMLLGKGDMLYASAVDPFPVRIQGTFVSDNDVEKVVEYVKSYGDPEYIDDEIFVDDDDVDLGPSLFNEGADPLYDQALDIVIQAGKASASYIQRRLKIGYNRAARLVEEMEERGIVGPANGSKPREVIHIPS
ncbi:DNA translocase FtsK, partial [uncultured Treponema sp.]|uniref:DNA translocase FtsK n=1 Tax=uncultured Treponema sp. TaxID=162155 RepID=UPI002598919D